MCMVAQSGTVKPATSLSTPRAMVRFECHGYRGGRRLGAKGREIGREHRGDGPERVFARETGRDAVLEHEDADVEHENHGYYLYEREQDGAYLAAYGHIQEYAEDVEREQGDDGAVDGPRNHVAEIVEAAAQRLAAGHGCAQTEHEGEDKSGHYGHHRRYVHLEEWREVHGRSLGLQVAVDRYERGKERGPREVADEAGHDSEPVGDGGREEQHLSGAASYVGDCRSHKSHYKQGDYEAEKFRENAVEGYEAAGEHVGKDMPGSDAKSHGDEYLYEQSGSAQFHGSWGVWEL